MKEHMNLSGSWAKYKMIESEINGSKSSEPDKQLLFGKYQQLMEEDANKWREERRKRFPKTKVEQDMDVKPDVKTETVDEAVSDEEPPDEKPCGPEPQSEQVKSPVKSNETKDVKNTKNNFCKNRSQGRRKRGNPGHQPCVLTKSGEPGGRILAGGKRRLTLFQQLMDKQEQ